MRRRRNIEAFSLSFLDAICCGFGAIILLLVLSKIYEPVVVEESGAPDHLAFRESRYGAVLVGDLVSTLSSVLIEPGEGHLRTYLDSLARLSELCSSTLYPGHGPPAKDGKRVVELQIEHRRGREAQLIEALRDGARSPQEIVERVYTDVDPGFWPMAELSVRAGLIKLKEEGRVELDDEDDASSGGPFPR